MSDFKAKLDFHHRPLAVIKGPTSKRREGGGKKKGMQRFGVGLVIERSLVRLPAGALSSQLGQLSLPSLWGR